MGLSTHLLQVDLDNTAFTPPKPAELLALAAITAEDLARPPLPSPEEDDCLAQDVANSMRLGQSYKSIGFEKERAIVNQALVDRSEWSANCPEPILNAIKS